MISTSSFADCSYELFSISSSKNTKIMDFVEHLSDECGFSIIITDPAAEEYLHRKSSIKPISKTLQSMRYSILFLKRIT